MMKNEFEALIGKAVTREDYEKVEYIYMNNEFFTNTHGKQQVSDFYKAFGMEGVDQMYRSTKATVDELAALKTENNRLLAASLLEPKLPAAAIDALNYAIACLLRKRTTYFEIMSASLEQHDREEYNRAHALDCELWERISAMQKLLPGA